MTNTTSADKKREAVIRIMRDEWVDERNRKGEGSRSRKIDE